MNFGISLAGRQTMEHQIKANLAVVYPNALPDVLALEVRMVESKAFATATSRGNYLVNVSSYIETHKQRTDGAQHVQRIPKFTRQEENARRAKVRKRIIAGDEQFAQNAFKHHHPTPTVGPNPSSMPQPVPVATVIGSSAQTLHTQARLSRHSSGITSAQLGQPASDIAARSHLPFSRGILPQGQSFSQQKILEVTKALEKERVKAIEAHREKVLKGQRDNALLAQQTLVNGVAASQRAQLLAQQVQNSSGLCTRQMHGLHSLQTRAQRPASAHPQAHWTLAKPDQRTGALQMRGLSDSNRQIMQSETMQTRQPHTSLQTQEALALRAQDPSLVQHRSQMARRSQPQVVNKGRGNIQSKIRTQQKTGAIAQGPSHSQVIAPPGANGLSQTQSSRFTDALDHLQTIEQTQNVPLINKSLQNTIQPPVQTRFHNQALPGMNLVRSLQKDPQSQNLVRNQPLPTANSVPQAEPMVQPKLPPQIFTDEALERLSSDQLGSLLKQAYDPCRHSLQAPAEAQNGNAEPLLSHAPNNPIPQLSAVPQIRRGSVLLPQRHDLQQAPVPALHQMASADDKKSENVPSTEAQNRGVLPRNDGSREQGLPLGITRNETQPLHFDQNAGPVSSVQEKLATQTKVFPASAPPQRVMSNLASPEFPYPKQYGDNTVTHLARAAVRLDAARRNSENYSAITKTQQRVASRAAEDATVSSHANPGLTGKSEEVTYDVPAQNLEPPLPVSREKQVLLAKWVTFQRDYRTRLDRIFPILETLFANPTDDEKRMLKNIQTVRTVLHKSTTYIAENQTANSSYHIYLTFVCRVFRKYSKYEHMTQAKLEIEARSRNRYEGGVSEHSPMRHSQTIQKSSVHGISNSANPVPTAKVGEQARSGSENLEVSAQQSKNMGALTQQNRLPVNANTKDQRRSSASQLANRPDPKRIQEIVQQHIRRNVDKKIRDYIANSAYSGARPEQTDLTGQNILDRAEQANIPAKMAESEIENPDPVPGSPFDGKHVLQGTKVTTANPAARNPIPVKSGQANMINSSTDNQRESRRYSIDGNFDSQPGDVHISEATAQQNAEDAANRLNQERTLENSENVETNGENSQADDILEKMKQSLCRFQQAVDEDPILNGSIMIVENDTRTDEEVITDLQDLLDGKRSREKSARVDETLKDLECDGKGGDELEMRCPEPAAKKRKRLSLREMVELDCERIHKSNDSVKCNIQEEHDTLVVTCNVHFGEDEIPILNMRVLEGYPSRGKVQYNLETPASGWLPPFDVMRSRFVESMRSETGDCSVRLVVGKWFTVVVQTVLTFE